MTPSQPAEFTTTNVPAEPAASNPGSISPESTDPHKKRPASLSPAMAIS
jgi:hypothetical protein